jgi:PAS domain S-box-containing protein
MLIEIEKILDTMIDGYILITQDGKIINTNHSYCQMSGYSKEELLNLSIPDIEFIDDEEKVRSRLEKVVHNGSDRFESIHKRKDGSTYPVEVSINIIYENDTLYFSAIFQDITAKKRINNDLSLKEMVFNHSLDMLCIAGFDGYFKVLNPAWQKTLGWSNEELLENPWNVFVYKDDLNKTENIKSKIVGGEEVFQFENRYICKNGDIKWLSWNSFPYYEDGIMFGVARDITAKKRAEEILLESEEKYRLLFDNITEAFALHKMIYDENENPIDYIFLDVNKYFEKLTGLKKEDIIGKNALEIIPEIENSWIKAYGKVAQSGEPFTFENNFKEIDKYFYGHSFSPKKDHFAVVFSDITEKKLIEAHLNKAKLEAEESNRAKSEFLSNMSHEIRTPMNGILGFVDILLENEDDDEKIDLLDTVKVCSKQLQNIVNDILSLSKIESGKYMLEENIIDLYSLLETIISLYKEQAKSKGLDFISDIDSNLKKEILVDEKSLLQIINNLLSNAIKFTEKGFILFTVSESSNNTFKISVKDTGIGINKDKQERLFEPFYQGEHFLTKKFGGTGLGLSIVKKLVDILNGDIKVVTEEGKGTQFTLTISYKDLGKQNEKKETTKLNLLKKDKIIKIISAEDVEVNQMLLEKIFKKYDWEMTKVYNGQALIEAIEKESYDIILMDIQMPKMNGYEATKAIRSNKNYDEIPIIGLSAYAFDEDIKKALLLGMNDYISKPIDIEKLIEKIVKWVK